MPATSTKKAKSRSDRALGGAIQPKRDDALVRRIVPRSGTDVVVQTKDTNSILLVQVKRVPVGKQAKKMTATNVPGGIVIEVHADHLVLTDPDTLKAESPSPTGEYREYTAGEIVTDRAADFFNSLVE